MQLNYQTPESWKKNRVRILHFCSRNGDKKITLATLHALRTLENEKLQLDHDSKLSPAAVVTVTHERQLVGLGFAIDDGSSHCLIVVHPKMRKKGIGSSIMKALINRLSHFSCHVAVDNIASMTMCFKQNLHAVSIFRGPTGKHTLQFERSPDHESPTSRHSNSISK